MLSASLFSSCYNSAFEVASDMFFLVFPMETSSSIFDKLGEI